MINKADGYGGCKDFGPGRGRGRGRGSEHRMVADDAGISIILNNPKTTSRRSESSRPEAMQSHHAQQDLMAVNGTRYPRDQREFPVP